MIINQTFAFGPTAFPFFPDTGHTCVSCPHPNQQYPHNTLWLKNDSPNKAFSSNSRIDGITALMFALSAAPISSIPILSVESSLPDAHDPAVNSIQQLHNLQNHILHL